MTPILVPPLGEMLSEVRVVRWLKQCGERVLLDEPVVELTTEKIDFVLASPHEGTLTQIDLEAGQVALIGQRLGGVSR